MTPKNQRDLVLQAKPDRRLLFQVPVQAGGRSKVDRRSGSGEQKGKGLTEDRESEQLSRRYVVDCAVQVAYTIENGSKKVVAARGVDLSATGILLVLDESVTQQLHRGQELGLQFEIMPGTMPEGYEMKVHIKGKLVRQAHDAQGNSVCGIEFSETLAAYARRKKDRYRMTAAASCLCLIAALVVIMRMESMAYFKLNPWIHAYSIIAATFLLTRYLFGACYRATPIDVDFTPGVTIIVPCFNEETWIARTVLGCINQDYPPEQLEVIIVDDCSTDKSVAKIEAVIDGLTRMDKQYTIRDRVKCIVQKVNKGKREALAEGAAIARHDLIVFVDSDSILDPFAVRNIVQPFRDTKMGGVSGRTDVANAYTNTLTKMQAVRYYIAFRIMKAAEGCFDAVTCLSGPLSCYRKDLVLTYMDEWLNQSFLGQRATFGDDRSMTNLILRHHRTTYQDTAICSTIVPNTYRMFLKQQMRWKRSWLRESLLAGKFMWRKKPFMALSFYSGLIMPIAAPIVVLYNLVYVPFVHEVFPTTFLIGLFLMAMMMSMAQLFLRKSSTWIFGLWFCLYYEAVLLWQMPVAWVTFWKSTWGTRMTPADLAELAKKQRRKGEKSHEDIQ